MVRFPIIHGTTPRHCYHLIPSSKRWRNNLAGAVGQRELIGWLMAGLGSRLTLPRPSLLGLWVPTWTFTFYTVAKWIHGQTWFWSAQGLNMIPIQGPLRQEGESLPSRQLLCCPLGQLSLSAFVFFTLLGLVWRTVADKVFIRASLYSDFPLHEFIHASLLWYLEDTVSLESFITYNSHNLSDSSST